MRLCHSLDSNCAVKVFRQTVPQTWGAVSVRFTVSWPTTCKPYRETTRETSGGHPYTVTLEVYLVHTGGSAKTKRFQPIVLSSVRNLSYFCGIFC